MAATKPYYLKTVYAVIIATLAIWVAADFAAARQKVVLVTGEVMEVDQARLKEGRVWITWSGLSLSIDEKDVLRIESDGTQHIIVHDKTPVSETQTTRPQAKNTSADRIASHRKTQTQEPLARGPATNPAGSRNRPKQTPDKPKEPSEPADMSAAAEQLLAFLHSDGFGDLKWGDPREKHPDLKRLFKDSGLPDVTEYVRPDDSLQLGPGSKAAVIKYAFWKDRLYMVTLWASGSEGFQSVRGAMVNKFGRGIQKPDHPLTLYWIDDDADRMIEYLEDKDLGFLWMRSREINNQYKLARLRIPISAGQSASAGASE